MRIPGSVCALSSLLAFSLQSSFGDVIDASLRLRFDFAAAPVNNVVIDASPSGVHPGANENATWVASEVGRNGVMEFVAPVADRITMPPNPALNSPEGTILFWIKTPGASGPGDYAEIIMDRRTTEGDVITVTDAGNVFVQARGGNQNVNAITSTGTVTDNQWHHIAYVYDQSASGSISIYIDGVLDSTQANSGAWTWPPAQPLEIGSSHDPFWRELDGLLDDFMVHNRMLSADEVAAAAAGSPVTGNSMVLRLNFDAAPVNDVIVDSSASNNSGTNDGAEWIASDSGRTGLMRFAIPLIDKIVVAPDPDFDGPVGTIAFWMRSTGNVGFGDFASILFDRRENGTGDVITMADDGTIFVQAQGSSQNVNSFSTQGKVNDGAWHHVAYVFDQSATGFIKIYIDGALSGSQNNSAEWAWPTDQPLELGASHDSFWHRFNGGLDEVRFYNRALTAAEIADVGVPPTIHFDTQPESQTVFAGDDVVFKGLANVEATYQWELNGFILPDETNSTLVISNVQLANNTGKYTVTATSPLGSVTSDTAVLTVYPRPSLTASLVARYNFEASPVNDVIVDTAPGGEHPGTNVFATWVAEEAGHSGVMQFISDGDGSQFVVSPHTNFDSAKGAITFWIKTPGAAGSGNFGAIIFDRRSDRGDVMVVQEEGTLFVQAYGPSSARINVFSTTATINDDQWHHVAYVYDQTASGHTRIYLDGQLVGDNPNAGTWAWDPAQPLEFGKSHDSYWHRLDGFLDDVQIFNRTLSQAEVTALVNPGAALQISKTGNQISISWSDAGFALEENSDLGNANGWSPVAGGATSPVTITAPASGNKFYRLHKP